MPISVIKAITKVELAKLVINEFGVDDSWLPTDDELSKSERGLHPTLGWR